MAEGTRVGYRRLFEVRVLHHYWLDDGATRFDDIADEAVRTRRLLTYDARPIVSITPSQETASMLDGLGGVFRCTGLGLVVAVPDDAVVDGGSRFEFFLTPASGELASYTAMTLRPQRVVDVSEPSSGRIHRYKEGTPVLSNLTGAARTWGGTKRLFLSAEYPTSGDRVEELHTAGGQARQLTSDQPNATFQALGPTPDVPVYLHQGDAPVVVAPSGVVGAPARGIELSEDMPADVLAVIRLAPRRTGDVDYTFVDGAGRARAVCPVFEVHLKNRATTWRYRSKRTGAVIGTEPQPRPLTHFGNAGANQKPTIGGVNVERDPASPSRVASVVSEVFV